MRQCAETTGKRLTPKYEPCCSEAGENFKRVPTFKRHEGTDEHDLTSTSTHLNSHNTRPSVEEPWQQEPAGLWLALQRHEKKKKMHDNHRSLLVPSVV